MLHSPVSQSDQSESTLTTAHTLPYNCAPMHASYPYFPGLVHAPPLRHKRHQVKNACTKCKKACKKCDESRPCLRCIRYGIGDECVDSPRKERKKGMKRGPYKKRGTKGMLRSCVSFLFSV